MKVYGLDFTSAPSRRKPITCVAGEWEEQRLIIWGWEQLPDFDAFQGFLQRDGPWMAAIDFPFGLPRQLIADLGWPATWEGYVGRVGAMDKQTFVATILGYCRDKPPKQKHLLRTADARAGARSPMMVIGVPVGKMFYQGAPRLLRSPASIVPCRPTPATRVVVEGYPALVARGLIGRCSYKTDDPRKWTPDREAARRAIVDGLRAQELRRIYGCAIDIPRAMVGICIREPTGDTLDALLCAVQVAWACSQPGYGIPPGCDAEEGWIADPTMGPGGEGKRIHSAGHCPA